MPASTGGKGPDAFRTIGEVAAELGIAQHILRYWETKFTQLKPLQRAGGRRYYRPEDVALLRQIDQLLNRQGYTVRGVQQLLKSKEPLPEPVPVEEDLISALRRVRTELVDAISD